jgi:signal transduction histidine kinase
MSGTRQRTILVVDDNADDRAEIRRLLRGHRDVYTLVEETTGEAGLARCRTDPPDCVLLDYYLPDMEGTGFLEALRAGGAPSVPVTMLTGKEDEETASRVLSRGAQDYLVKGTLTGHGLVRAVENAIGKFQVALELEEKRAALELRTWQLEALRDELRSRLAELADAHHAKDQFMAVMSHEMRTPLNAILGYADLMEMGVGGELPQGQRHHLERIRVGGRHLLDLINDVLDLAQAEAQRLEMDLRPVDLEAVVEEVVALLESQAEAKGIGIRLEAPDEQVPHVQADLRRLRQVLTNLLGNAVKFTDEGTVTVRFGVAADGTVRVHVADTGIGIDPDVLPLVFGEFYQAQGSLTRERGGSGLGLAISQRLARQMGGDIDVESTLGDGSVFTLTLRTSAPGSELRAADVEAHRAATAERDAARKSGESARASVVAFCEDEEALRGLAERVSSTVRLVYTTDAGSVAELARRERASLVVLDVTCADGAAWRIAHEMQEVPELVETAVLLLPRIPSPAAEDAPGELDLGWVSLVPKPFTQEQLTHAVSHAAGTAGDDGAEGPEPPDVLVVDDDADSRRVAAGFLAEARARVREAADGESALAAMRRAIPDVVVLDLMMPVLDGFGVLAAMHADPRLARIPVVVLSAKTLTEAERKFLARTAVRVLQKGEHRLNDVAALVLRAAGVSPDRRRKNGADA